MNYWLLGYIFSVFCTATAYLTGLNQLAELPLLVVTIGLAITIGRWVLELGGRIHQLIATPITLIGIALGIFVLKHIGMGGSPTNPLFIKLTLYLVILIAGILIGFHERTPSSNINLLAIGFLFIFPLLFFVIFAKGETSNRSVTLFNRNVFASYFILTSTFLLGWSNAKPIVNPILHSLICFSGLVIIGTLGALVAFAGVIVGVFAIRTLASFDRLRGALILGVFAGIPLVLIFLLADFGVDGGVWIRLNFVYQTTLNLMDGYQGSLVDLDMATAVQFAADGELDMSAFFRILHWINIYDVLLQGGTTAILLGGGTDWVFAEIDTFVFNLAAHNEHLRLLVEQGLLLGGMFIAGLVTLGLSLRQNPAFVPIFTIIVFFGSENQLNDFLSTSLFFLTMGLLVGRERRKRAKHVVSQNQRQTNRQPQ